MILKINLLISYLPDLQNFVWNRIRVFNFIKTIFLCCIYVCSSEYRILAESNAFESSRNEGRRKSVDIILFMSLVCPAIPIKFLGFN